ncbi:fibronectin type III domain-containing protein [Nocardioides sp. zg-ZUI104]|uniref:Ig-like domain-containing protein n=1 Tax=Nocardioides faecalis TaxID=2803858 RepID=UPI001BCEB782|nr:Ig-like domain-containing protein [Nocardioides faecalis]MBS4754148.1 fibronectin type III domain-containing protein [Nocardioides faecalis]
MSRASTTLVGEGVFSVLPSRVRRVRRTARSDAPRRRVVQALALSLVAGTLVVLALRHDGAPIHDVELNDGGVWVTNAGLGMMARLNSQVSELELGVVTSSTATAVYQEAGSVQVYDDGGGGPTRSVAAVDVLTGVATPVPVPPTFEAVAGRATVAILDDESGRVWLRRADRLEGFETTPADVEVSPRSSVTVSATGTALVLDRATGEVASWSLDASGRPVAGPTYAFGEPFEDDPALSAVGDVPVVLQGSEVRLPDTEPVTVPGAGEGTGTVAEPVLQQVGPEADRVLLATREALWAVPLDGGDAERLSDLDVDGVPAPPAVVDGCVHAAWNHPLRENYLRLCEDGDVFTGEITPLTDASLLVFRSNRDVVVLNDVANGTAWMVQEDGLTRVDNWETIDPNAEDPQEAKVSEELRDRKRNEPPQAQDDEFGARPGSTVVLPVTLNDVDPDGDILTLKQPPASTDAATYSVVGEGTQVQAKLAPDASGTLTFEYEITDGRPQNPPSKATVTLTVHGDGQDTAPELLPDQRNTLRVAEGHTATLNVLPAWIDPEGDSLALVAATSEGGDVGFRPDGTIDFTDDAGGTGPESIEFTVRGGDVTAEGVVAVSVEDRDEAAPVAVADHFAGVVGSTILLEPLKNDTDPLGGQLSLPTMKTVAGGAARLTRDSARGTATFRADSPGAYYLEYAASSANGQTSEPTLVRVDVQPASGTNRPPVATRDVAAVRPDGSTLVDVLANDADPDGDVMIVQGVEVAARHRALVKASLINKRFVRVEVIGDLAGERPEITYLLSDGRSDQVRGTVSVTLADESRNRRPVAVEDVVTVRAGTVVDIPVTDNDEDPDGDRLTVSQQDLFDLDEQSVIADATLPIIADGTSIRVLVPDDGTTQLQVGYGVRDPDGARADARLVLNIKPDDAEDNQAPQPPPIEDRTVTGHAIRVPVSTFGADPDGDPVVYSSLVEPPTLGRILRSGADWFEYEPFEGDGSTGTDSFKVLLTDPYGLSATADVRIGVAPRSRENQAPAALDDTVLVKPGLTINYPVTQNDSDPDGDPLIVEEGGFRQLQDGRGDDRAPRMRLADSVVQVDVPELGGAEEISGVAQYRVSDGLGASSSAFLTVTARDDAPDHAPVTQDDVAEAAALDGKAAGDTVDVDVLANDGDLDGPRSALRLEPVSPDGVSVVDRKLRITLRKESQVVPYRVTDATEQTSFGFVYVAGTDSMPPVLDVDAVPVKVTAGEAATIDLDDVVVVRAGRTPKIARTDRITAAHGDAEALDAGRLEFLAPRSYHGAASITLGVLDGEDQNDPDGLQSQITIPVTVLPAANVAPTVRSTSVVVRAGDDPVEIDLTRLATDINEDDRLDFSVTGATDELSAEVSGDLLRIRADESASSDDVALTVAADDGEADPATGTVRVTVIGAEDVERSQPPLRLRELEVGDAEVGTEVVLDLAAAVLEDHVPEANEVVAATATGPASAPVVSGTVLRITPTDAGRVVVSYRMDDGSGLAEREVSSRVLITVAGPPERPAAPRAVQGGPDSVQLTWSAPDDNGSPITHYLVGSEAGEQRCQATQCVVGDLDPGRAYRFTVKAVNAVGTSEASPASAPVTPDEVPGRMAAPVVTDAFSDRDAKLHLRWSAPANNGSDITGYRISVNPGGKVREVGAGETSLVWDGLSNGTSYTFQILAVNDAGAGVLSPPSAPAVPFTTPTAMAAPEMQVEPPNDDGKGYLTVSWPALGEPGNGYDAVASYDVKVLVDGAELTTVQVDGQSTSRSFDVENGHGYTAQVRASNRAGTAEAWSPQSEAKVAWDRSRAVTAISKASDCVGCTASPTSYQGRVSFTTPADDGGFPVVAYQVETKDGWSGRRAAPTQAEGTEATLDVPFRSNAADQWVRLTPITQPTGQPETSGASAQGGDFDPFAKPRTPSNTEAGRGYMSVTIGWNGGDGNGRTVDKTEYRGDASGTRNGRSGGSVTIATEEGGQRRCIQVRSHTADGGWSEWSGEMCASAEPRTLEVYYVRTTDIPAADCARPCYYTKFRVTGFRAGTYTASRRTYGPGPCAGTGGGGWDIRVGSDGRGDVGATNKWWISSTCDADSATVDGLTDRRNVP